MLITICASASFYEHVVGIAEELENSGHEVLLPKTAEFMRKNNNYEPSSVKTWLKDGDYSKVTELINTHYKKIEQSGAVLIVNDQKEDKRGYIGPNVTMEMGLAFYLGKRIFILNPVELDNPVSDEVRGVGAVFINGDLSLIK